MVNFLRYYPHQKQTKMVRYRVAVGKMPNGEKFHVYVDLCGEEGPKGDECYQYRYFHDPKKTVDYLRSTVIPYIRNKFSKDFLLIGGEGIADDPIIFKLSALNDEIVRKPKPLKTEKNLETTVQEEKPEQDDEFENGLLERLREGN
jgi:hypothetical protein